MTNLVSVVKYEKPYDSVRKAVEMAKGLDHLPPKSKVFIKPNLTYPVYKKGVTTRYVFVRNIVAALKRLNKELEICIGEGEGGYNSFSMTEAMARMKCALDNLTT